MTIKDWAGCVNGASKTNEPQQGFIAVILHLQLCPDGFLLLHYYVVDMAFSACFNIPY